MFIYMEKLHIRVNKALKEETRQQNTDMIKAIKIQDRYHNSSWSANINGYRAFSGGGGKNQYSTGD